MESQLHLFHGLADPTRLRIIALLRVMELAIGELAAVLEQSQPRVSRHVRILVDAGILVRQREGGWVFLRVAAGAGIDALLALLDGWPGTANRSSPTRVRRAGNEPRPGPRAARRDRAVARASAAAAARDAFRDRVGATGHAVENVGQAVADLELAIARGDIALTPGLSRMLEDLGAAIHRNDDQKLGGKSAEAARFLARAVVRELLAWQVLDFIDETQKRIHDSGVKSVAELNVPPAPGAEPRPTRTACMMVRSARYSRPSIADVTQS